MHVLQSMLSKKKWIACICVVFLFIVDADVMAASKQQKEEYSEIYNYNLSLSENKFEVKTDTYEVVQIKESIVNDAKGSYYYISYPYIKIKGHPKLSATWNELVYKLAGDHMAVNTTQEYNSYHDSCYTITYSDNNYLSIYFQGLSVRNQNEYGLVLSIKDGIIKNISDFGITDKQIYRTLTRSKLKYSKKLEKYGKEKGKLVWKNYKSKKINYNYILMDSSIGLIIPVSQTDGSYLTVEIPLDWNKIQK